MRIKSCKGGTDSAVGRKLVGEVREREDEVEASLVLTERAGRKERVEEGDKVAIILGGRLRGLLARVNVDAGRSADGRLVEAEPPLGDGIAEATLHGRKEAGPARELEPAPLDDEVRDGGATDDERVLAARVALPVLRVGKKLLDGGEDLCNRSLGREARDLFAAFEEVAWFQTSVFRSWGRFRI